MSLVSANDFSKLLKLNDTFLGNILGKFILFITRLNVANRIYDRNKNKIGIDYLDALLNDYEVKYTLSKKDFEKLPKEGAFITVSNHPLGGIDGVLLLKNVLLVRSDFKVIANFLLQKQEPIKDFILPVNPFEDRKEAKSNLNGLKASLLHLQEGKPLGIFPAGEVSTIKERNIYVDNKWDPRAIKLIKKSKVPVVPIYFQAKNSKLFYFLSKLHPVLRTLKLPSELNKKNQIIEIKIGEVIKVKEIESITDLDLLNSFLREKTYLLSKTCLIKKKLIKQYKSKIKKRVKKVALPKNQKHICLEIDQIRSLNKRLFISNEYEVFLTKADQIPNLMEEIGRLREITFRLIGEGTNKKSDTDLYDEYYHHLILWNKEEQAFVGAYRMGFGKEIMNQKGFKSFYISNFFNFSKEMNDKLPKTIEMGRAFIVPEFQQKAMPLFLLWKGIAVVTVRYPEYEYLMGGATITNLFSNYSKSALIYFLDKFYRNKEIKPLVSSKCPFKVDLTQNEKLYIDNFLDGKVKKLSKLIKAVEEDKLKMPVLIKQYIKQNAKFVAYNVDRNFNDAIDALIFMKISDIPKSTIDPILKDLEI